MILLFYDFISEVLLPETFFINVKDTALRSSLARLQPYDDIPDSVIRSPDFRGTLMGLLESRAITKLNRGSDVVSKVTGVQARGSSTNGNAHLLVEFAGPLGRCRVRFIPTSVRNDLLRISVQRDSVTSNFTWQAVGLVINHRGFNLRRMIEDMGESMFESAERQFDESWEDELDFVDGKSSVIRSPTYSARLLDGEWLWTHTMDFRRFSLASLFQ